VRQLDSKNYNEVNIFIRDVDEPITVSRTSGDALMDWLSSVQNAQLSHVQITDLNGTTGVYSRHSIRKIEPIYLIDVDPITDEEIRKILGI
jgi:hypothetical protein